jgi:hypothetical protein
MTTAFPGMNLGSGWQRDCNKAVDYITGNNDMSIPLKKSEAENWLLCFTTLFQRDYWLPGVMYILDQHPGTSSSNLIASRNLCQIILQLALKDKINKVFHELNSARGASLLASKSGIELFQHLKLRLAPEDMNHLREYYRDP